MAYRKPWTGGAKAYPEIDSLADLPAATYRKRNTFIAHIPRGDAEVDALPCATCSQPLGGPAEGSDKVDRWTTITISPRAKRYVLQHYVCSWQTLMTDILRLGRAM